MQVANAKTVDATLHSLYRIGGVAALFGVAIIPIQLFVFITWPPPETAAGWFTLFQSNALGGLLAFEILFPFNAIFGIATTLALYFALRRFDEAWMAIALVLGIVEAIALVVSRPAVEMLHLSQQYASATTDAQRALLLAAGESMLATFDGTAFHVSYNLFSVVFLIISLVMLRSAVFGKATGIVGILAALLNWGLYVPGIGLLLSMLSILPLAIWNILVAVKLLQLGRGHPLPLKGIAQTRPEPAG